MTPRSLASFLVAFLTSLSVLAGAGYGIGHLTIGPPRDPFRAGSFEFDLATGWSCDLEGTEYVCVPPGKPPRGAIAVMAIKERAGDDNLQAYEDHLRASLEASGQSTDGYVGRRRLGGREWVEALVMGSELRSYLTYYLGTNTSNLGILVTMSVHRDHKGEFIGQLTEMMATLHVYQR